MSDWSLFRAVMDVLPAARVARGRYSRSAKTRRQKALNSGLMACPCNEVQQGEATLGDGRNKPDALGSGDGRRLTPGMAERTTCCGRRKPDHGLSGWLEIRGAVGELQQMHVARKPGWQQGTRALR